MSGNEDLAERLRTLAATIEQWTPDDFTSHPSWGVLREAAAALSAGCQHVPLTGTMGDTWCFDCGERVSHVHGTHTGHDSRRLYVEPGVEAEQTKQENDDE